MPPTDNFDAWLEEELRALLPAGDSPAPARRLAAARAHRWSRLLGWLLPPISGKLLVATTALAVAGTAAAASGHVSLPLGHPNRAVVRGISPAPAASAAPAVAGTPGAARFSGTPLGEGLEGSDAPPAASRGRASVPAPEPAAEAPSSAAQPGESPQTDHSPQPAQSVQLMESPEPSSPAQGSTTSPP